MKQFIFLLIIFTATAASATDVVPLSNMQHPNERIIVESMYAKDIKDAKTLPTNYGPKVDIEIGIVDLNNDGKNEIIARLVHPFFCGAQGCMLVVLSKDANGNWEEILNVISDGEVEVRSSRVNGYRTLTFGHGSKEWIFNGKEYKFK
jgi:hypothetical protein